MPNGYSRTRLVFWQHASLRSDLHSSWELPVARRILIVEDEPMIVMMVETFLQELGWNVVGVVDTLAQALAMARDADMDAALLDVNLNGLESFSVGDVLGERHIPFVFATGYGAKGIPDRFRGVPTLAKPYPCDELGRALHEAMTVARGSEARLADPGSRASPGKTTGPRR
jgi:CheY-like chemotaxis protein